ncbi:MAG: hypothetical protein JW741_24605 [Sedimentisphaerales bacterium]|nr:hypothetical protein [Sedimentisphaerales bacterium]
MKVDIGQTLPCVRWGQHRISRLIIGHNPIKGWSHYSDELTAEMKAWHSDRSRVLATLRRCEECGINTAQFGGTDMHTILQEHRATGGRMQWIATFYGNDDGNLGIGQRVDIETELKRILAVDPVPIGIQHFGERTDRLYFDGRLDAVREAMKRLRDTGLLIGVCTHLPEVAETVASENWDLDFLQLSFFTAYAGTLRPGIDRTCEIFEDEDRERMARLISQLDKPCIVFKVLGANRKCGTEQDVQTAMQYAYAHIKDDDVVCVGMWQKHKDQVGQDADIVRNIHRHNGSANHAMQATHDSAPDG